MEMTTHPMTEEDIKRRLAEAMKVNGRDVTWAELSLAFDAVAPRDDWKNPIERVLHLDADTLALVRRAVAFFTGSEPTFEQIGTELPGDPGVGLYRVRAAGYYGNQLPGTG